MNAHLLGIFSACINEGVKPADFEHIKGAASGLHKSPAAEAFGRQLAGLAEEIYVKSGHAEAFEARLYGQLAKTAAWNDFHYDMLDPVLFALSKFQGVSDAVKQAREVDATIEKSATALAGLRAAIGKVLPALAASPGMLFGTAGVAGAGLGALNWSMNRASTDNDVDSAMIENQIDNYNRLQREIADELKRNPPPALRAAMRNKLDQAESPGYAL